MKAQDMLSAEVRAEGICTDYSYGMMKEAGEEREEGSRVLEREPRVEVHAWAACLLVTYQPQLSLGPPISV